MRNFHAPSATTFIATNSLKEQLLEWGFKNKLKFLTRGVELPIFHPDASNDPPDLLKDLKRPIALYVGRMAIEKNLEAFLDMEWAGSKVMVGDGPTRLMHEKAYPDVLFVGKKLRDELAAYYRASDVFVFPSKTDTFGIVLIEALACGLPVAGFNVMGPKDIITHDYLGAIEEDDLQLAANRAIEQVDKEKCVQYVIDNFSWRASAEQFISAL